MIATRDFIDHIATLIAADATWLAAASPNLLNLVIAPFAPSPALSLSDLTLAAAEFDGCDPKTVAAGMQLVVRDAVNGAMGILLKEPVGGFKWIAADAPVVPVNVYGIALTDSDATVLIATVLLDPTPQVVQFVGDFIEVSAVFGFLPISLMLPRQTLTPLV